MSTSTNAYLFYGICWDEEDHFWPWHPEHGTLPEEERAGEEELDDAWLARAHPPLGAALSIGEHCCRSAPMGFVAVDETFQHAWRGYPKKLDVRDAARCDNDKSSEWNSLLSRFCAAAGYDFGQLVRDGKVGWFLCSWWED